MSKQKIPSTIYISFYTNNNIWAAYKTKSAAKYWSPSDATIKKYIIAPAEERIAPQRKDNT